MRDTNEITWFQCTVFTKLYVIRKCVLVCVVVEIIIVEVSLTVCHSKDMSGNRIGI